MTSRGAQVEAARLPDAAAPGAVHLQVSELRRSVTFYRDVLGLRVRTATATSAELAPAEDPRVLVTLTERPDIVPAPRRSVLGLYHFAVLLPTRADLGRFLAHALRRGEQVGLADHAVSEAVYLSDPDGLGIEVYADRPRASWRYSGREIFMTTEPLDVDDLISAGGGAEWTGAPAGTVIGHVHLHVGDLQAAEAFYHAALGFDVTVRGYPGAVFLSAGGYHHHLGTNTWASGPPAAPNQAKLLAWDLVVPGRSDADAAAARLRDAGHVVEADRDGWIATDPWDIRVRLVGRV
jgi:catechol 2,3-dioxygenase